MGQTRHIYQGEQTSQVDNAKQRGTIWRIGQPKNLGELDPIEQANQVYCTNTSETSDEQDGQDEQNK